MIDRHAQCRRDGTSRAPPDNRMSTRNAGLCAELGNRSRIHIRSVSRQTAESTPLEAALDASTQDPFSIPVPDTSIMAELEAAALGWEVTGQLPVPAGGVGVSEIDPPLEEGGNTIALAAMGPPAAREPLLVKRKRGRPAKKLHATASDIVRETSGDAPPDPFLTVSNAVSAEEGGAAVNPTANVPAVPAAASDSSLGDEPESLALNAAVKLSRASFKAAKILEEIEQEIMAAAAPGAASAAAAVAATTAAAAMILEKSPLGSHDALEEASRQLPGLPAPRPGTGLPQVR